MLVVPSVRTCEQLPWRRYNEDVANGLALAPPSPEAASSSGTVEDVFTPGSGGSTGSSTSSWFHNQCALSFSSSTCREINCSCNGSIMWWLTAREGYHQSVGTLFEVVLNQYSMLLTFARGLAVGGSCWRLASVRSCCWR